jgi:glutathione S-transferase
MVDNNVTLGYWGFRGKGQLPRLLLAYGAIKNTNKNYTSTEQWFGGDKQSLDLPFPNLPYLIDGNLKLTESAAICRYIIKKSEKKELLGKDMEDEAIVDNIIGVIDDISTPTAQLCFNDKFNDEKEKVFTDKIKAKVDYIYKFLGDKEWLLDYLTLADFKIAEAVNYLQGIWPEHFKEYPKLAALRDRFNDLPEIKDYYASEGAIKGPFLPPSAKWHN